MKKWTFLWHKKVPFFPGGNRKKYLLLKKGTFFLLKIDFFSQALNAKRDLFLKKRDLFLFQKWHLKRVLKKGPFVLKKGPFFPGGKSKKVPFSPKKIKGTFLGVRFRYHFEFKKRYRLNPQIPYQSPDETHTYMHVFRIQGCLYFI